MKDHNKVTRKIFNQIHLAQNKNKFSLDKIKYSLNENILGLQKGYFKNKICADLGCGSTGSGGFNLLNLGAKYCHLLDMHQHIKKPIEKNFKKFKNKYRITIGSLEKLPYPKDYFDFVLCQGVIHHMNNDLKGFHEIYRVLKKGGQTYISVHGRGGLLNDLTMNFLRPKYQKDKKFRKFLDLFLDKNHKKYSDFLKKNYNKKTISLFNKIIFLFDEDLKLTIKDRLMAPKYKTYVEKNLKIYLKKIGFKKIIRVKKKVEFKNLRRFIEPLYYHYDNEISKFLYGDGIIHFMIKK
ncbi:class I SAM-dependent methyltransferase [Candidatus Pelagibacter sp. Uisw_121]|uniref:class I SAM-dependent methyltransferase n=1 Tax=Candidatus Pelagibacter sp. Uisw_121 TaxID=3230987 RepID=UPI0039E7C429